MTRGLGSRSLAAALSLALCWLTPVNAALADEPGVTLADLDEPGPGPLAAPPTGPPYWTGRDHGATMRVGYRAFSINEMGGRDAWYNNVTVDYYFISKYVRAGGGIEFGVDSSPRDNFLISGSIIAGGQFPWRVTPFIDLVLCFGALRREVLHQNLYSFAYQVGLDFGADYFVHDRLFISTSIGWRHVGFRYPGNELVDAADVYFDSFTVKVGLGY